MVCERARCRVLCLYLCLCRRQPDYGLLPGRHCDRRRDSDHRFRRQVRRLPVRHRYRFLQHHRCRFLLHRQVWGQVFLDLV